ncbi:glutaminyl-peptide cyclotransferase-like a [Astyanax mexicanus]|uniref:glutaminyl-peptide cyclotransferase-like a n=1 Tax=Astyanax mexicanus TaxID=7994 RepID=UPI0020CB2D62|nr:glutaminyl-peptide cyclotransferase-like a [Astyanax mexicanus]XP_049339731.1 glutaminyl-peptide cyclotransferase-like a [Astyanax mexicanus]
MSRAGRRYRPVPGPGGSGCSVRAGSRRALLGCLGCALAVALMLGLYLSAEPSGTSPKHSPPDPLQDKFSHKPRKCSLAQVRKLAAQVDGPRLWETHLRPMLIERVPGTSGSQTVRQHILSQLRALSAGWTVEEDSFQSSTPKGPVSFSNVLAVLDPSAPRRLLLACHHDSKIFPRDPKQPQRGFIGASDSAVPCAMMLELASALDTELKALKQQKSVVTLQLVFFDGEEAFEEWTDTDSLYGSRHLAELMAHTPHPPGSTHTTLLQAMDLFVLLDLLGGPEPLIVSHFDNTVRWFDRLIAAETRLHRQGLLSSHPSEQSYFRKDFYLGPVQDDHIPFLQRGVSILHLIPTPFPSFWHTMQDTEENMHRPTVENLTKILAIFLAEYLHL